MFAYGYDIDGEKKVEMGTIIRKDGFEIIIHTQDHNPPHVHIKKSGTEVEINLDLSIKKISEMSQRDVKRAMEIVNDNLDDLLAAWEEIHG